MRIDTERLILRPVLDSDAEDIFEYASSPNVGPEAGWKPHKDLSETMSLMREIFVEAQGVFALINRENGKVMGTIGLIEDPKRQFSGARMLGYSIGEEYWGKGYTTEAAKALIDWGFASMDIALISAYCYPGNNRSRRVMEKCGFQYEGTLCMAEIRYDGVLLDNDCYCLLRDGWSQQKGKGE